LLVASAAGEATQGKSHGKIDGNNMYGLPVLCTQPITKQVGPHPLPLDCWIHWTCLAQY